MASKNLHLLMTADTKAAVTGLQQMQATLNTLKDRTAGLRQGLGALVGGADPFTQLKGTAMNLVGAIPEIGPAMQAALSVAEGAWNKIRDSQKSIADQGKSAQMTGASIEGYSGLLFALGGDADVLNKALFHMQDRLGQAAMGSDEARKTFTALGLDWEKMSGQLSDKNFKQVIGSLHKLGTERAALGKDIFGRGALEVMGAAAKGPGFLEKRAAVGKAAGRVFSGEDVAGMMEVNLAWKEIDDSVGSVWNKLAIGMGPAVKSIADDLKQVLAGSGNTGSNLQAEFLTAKESAKSLLNVWSMASTFDFGSAADTFQNMFLDSEKLADSVIKQQDEFDRAAKKRKEDIEKQIEARQSLIEQEKFEAEIQRELVRIEHEKAAAAEHSRMEAMSGYDKLTQRIGQLNSQMADGLITENQFAGALFKAVSAADKVKPTQSKLPEIAEFGSTAEASARARAEAAAKDSKTTETAIEKTNRILEALRTEARQTTQEAKGIREALKQVGLAKF